MRAFKVSCIIALVLFLACLSAFQLEQRDAIRKLESWSDHQYEIICVLKGEILDLQKLEQIKRNPRLREKG